MTVGDQDVSILEQGIWFRERDADFKSALLAIARVIELEPGKQLFRRGDQNDGVYAVLSGSVRISGSNEDGRESILTFIEAPDWFGELALFDDNPRTHDAVTELKSSLLHISHIKLTGLLREHPVYWKDFGIMLGRKLRLSFGLIEDMALLPAPRRLAKRLLLMAETYVLNRGVGSVILEVDQTSLGSMLSISRQTTNQILKDLQTKGLISLAYGQISIADLAALRNFVHQLEVSGN